MGTTAVDLGAQWIHGREGNPVYLDIVAPQAMRCVDTPYDPSTVFQQSGTGWAKMSSSQVDAMDARYEQLVTYIGKHQNSATDVSLLQTINRFVASRSPAWSAAQKRQLNFSVTGQIEHEYSADVGQLSTWWWDESLDSGATDCALPEGFSQVGGGGAVRGRGDEGLCRVPVGVWGKVGAVCGAGAAVCLLQVWHLAIHAAEQLNSVCAVASCFQVVA